MDPNLSDSDATDETRPAEYEDFELTSGEIIQIEVLDPKDFPTDY